MEFQRVGQSNIWAIKTKHFFYEVAEHIHYRNGFDLDKFHDSLQDFSEETGPITYYSCTDSRTIEMKNGYFIYRKNSNPSNGLMFHVKYEGNDKEAVDMFIDYLRHIDCIE